MGLLEKYRVELKYKRFLILPNVDVSVKYSSDSVLTQGITMIGTSDIVLYKCYAILTNKIYVYEFTNV